MLFTLGLLLLLAPFPSFQTTANERRNSTGSDVSKPNAGFALSKPKTTSIPAKQNPRPTVRPNTTNHTLLLTPATNQKPAAANPAGTTKSKASSAVTQATVPPTVKTNGANGTITNKGKLSATVNQTLVSSPATNQKLLTVNTTSNSKSKASAAVVQTTVHPAVKSNAASSTVTNKGKQSATVNQTLVPTPATNQKLPTVNGTHKNKANAAVIQATVPPPVKPTATNGTITNKGKQSVQVNQTVAAKSTSAAEVKASKDKLISSGTSNTQSNSTKPTLDKLQPLLNQTVKSFDGKIPKDKTATTIVQNVQSTSARSAPAGDAKTTNDKLKTSTTQTVSAKSPDVKAAQDKPPTTSVQNVQSTSSKSASAGGAKASNDKLQTSANHTVSAKSSDVKAAQEKPAPTSVQNVQSTSSKSAASGGAKTTNDKLQTSANQTVSAKSSDVKVVQDKPATTSVQNVQSTSPKSAPAGGAKAPRNKPAVSVNQTVVAKPTSTSEVKNSKDKSQTSSQVSKSTTASGSSSDKEKTGASTNQTTVSNAPTTTTVANTTKEKSAPSQPLKVVISDGCDSNSAKERELKLRPGAPLVMTHKISLVPGGCDGRCEMEMADLKGRVARLEKEMSLIRENCPCSANCPNDCSDNGECQKGKCVCHRGYVGPDCSKCAQGTDCTKKSTKGKTKETAEIVTQQKKDQKKVPEAKEPESKPRVTITAKPVTVKTQAKQDTSAKKETAKGSPAIIKTGRPTVTQVVLKHESKKQEESGKGKTAQVSAKVLQKPDQTGSKKILHKIVKQRSEGKPIPKSEQLKDEPQTNVTRGNLGKFNVTAKIVTILTRVLGTNKTRTGKVTLEQSTLAEKNDTQQTEAKQVKTIKVENTRDQTNNNRIAEAVKGKVTQKSQYIVNATITATADEARTSKDKTSAHGSGIPRRIGGSGLGSVKVMNISSYSFSLTWLAPQGLFKNFTVIRRESRAEGDEEDHKDFEEETLGLHKATAAKNPAEVHVQAESTDTTVASGKITGSRDKAETKRISMVVPGNVRSVEFSNLQANTRYVLYVYGSSAERRSKIHRVTAVTGPEPATEMVFSNVTESSLTVAWSKPKTPITGYRLSYTNIVTGESRFMAVDALQSSMVLSKLSAGSSYIISVTTTQGSAHGEALMSLITTVPAPPTHLQVVNVTDTRALLQWVASLGKVDRFVISFESSKTPNVTVTVMLPGNAVEHQLRGLQRGTLYTVKVLSQKDSLQSMAISTTFTTANVVKASEVGARSAVITWRSSTVVYHSYRVIYQVAGEEAKEVILDSTFTEYKLTGLLPMSRYMVLVQGERDGLYTSLVTTEFITGKLRFPFPTECSQELLNGALQSGEVDIYPQGKEGPAVRVYCDMESDGGGWTVLQRRTNGKTDFYRTWGDYKTGFGNLSEEFWLGNDLLHNLTSVGPVSLRVDMQSGNDTAYAHYANFSVDSEERHYTLTVSGYTGTAGDSMRYHNGRPFSTWDKDVDPLGIHCARAYMGGWWYKNCYKTNLNGLYGINSNNQGVVWIDWKGKDSSIPFTEMKFRPSRFSPATHG